MTERGPILLVEDDADHISIYSTLFTRAGYSLLVAETGAAALELMQDARPAAIVCDIRLGRQNAGLDLVHVLRATPATAGIPMLVYSAFTDLHEPELRRAGVPYMMKGADPYDLLRAVEQLITQRADPAAGGSRTAGPATPRPR